jgi:hypothetical protein
VSVKSAWIALALATIALVAWLGLRPAASTAPESDAAALAAAVARIEQAQARQDARLARIESRSAPGAGAYPAVARPARGGVAAANARGNGAPLDPAQSLVVQQSQLRSLDNRLVSEPLSAGWAQSQERAVAAFFAPASLQREGLQAPRASEARCQATLCRIRVHYDDGAAAAVAQAALLRVISPTLPHAQLFMLEQPDGSVELLVYAGSNATSVR